MLLDNTVAKRIFNFHPRIGRNNWGSKYRFGRQFSNLSNGPLNDSNRLAICELRQSETRLVTETIFLADHTFLYKIGFWWNFAVTSPETLYMKNVTNKLSFLLVAHITHFDIRFGRYCILKSYFSSGQVMDRLDCRCSVRFQGHKMGESC
jgi:hypothetical protein